MTEAMQDIQNYAETLSPLIMKYEETMDTKERKQVIKRLVRKGLVERKVIGTKVALRSIGGNFPLLNENMSRQAQEEWIAEAAVIMRLSGIRYGSEIGHVDVRIAA